MEGPDIEEEILRLEEETPDQRVVDEASYGFVTYHSGYRNEGVLRVSDSPGEILEFQEKGWVVVPGQDMWILRAPEIALCDLSNPLRNPVQDPEEIYKLHQALEEAGPQNVIDAVTEDLDARHLGGISTEAITKVGGADDRVKEVPMRAYDYLRDSEFWPEGEYDMRSDIRLEETRSEELPSRLEGVYSYLQEFYESVSNTEITTRRLNGVWEDLPEADVNLFVPKAGIKYFFGYVESQTTTPAMLWEHHRGVNPTKEVKFFERDLDGKTVNVIDKSYSGGTVRELGEKVESEGGYPQNISVFPKSSEAVSSSDYVLFGDTVLESEDINYDDDEWYKEAFREVMQIEEAVPRDRVLHD